MDTKQANEKGTHHCSNCGAQLNSEANYCPGCGQRNKEMVWSIRGFISDVFEHYLALDSKIGHTLYPFLLKPGQLTREYISGRRAYYVRPIRLYLFSSIVFFFLLAMMVKSISQPELNLFNTTPYENTAQAQDRRDSLLSKLPGLHNVPPTWISQNSKVLVESELASLSSPNVDIDVSLDGKQITSFDSILQLANNLELSEEEILHRVKLSESELSPFNRELFKRLIRIYRTNARDIYQLIIGNIPFMMFVLVPLFAVLLKLAYWRRKNWHFLHHVIHSLHLHSLFYLLGIVIVVVYWVPFLSSLIETLILILALLGLNVYWWQSLRYVYGRSPWKTSLTYLFLVTIYLFLSVLALLSEVLVSLYFL